MTLYTNQLTTVETQYFLQHLVAPRPIALASTIDNQGKVNLSPFSFFNLFSTQPPVIVFSPSRRMRDNTTKHTLQNVIEVPEVVINIVDYDMVHQTSLASCEFPRCVNEFIKTGLTPEASTIVKPPLVKESKIKMECKVIEIKSLGETGGAGNLVLCEVLVMHIDNTILNEKNMIDQQKMHHVARLGGDWYCKVDTSNLFIVEKPNQKTGIGVDALPASIAQSRILSGNDLGQLANVQELPDLDPSFHDTRLVNISQYYSIDPQEMEKELHHYAKELLHQGKVKEAWQVLLQNASYD
jgi:flavin reductase (DIM6/NTAB) family NADH-FMN oxidoreductase RutF